MSRPDLFLQSCDTRIIDDGVGRPRTDPEQSNGLDQIFDLVWVGGEEIDPNRMPDLTPLARRLAPGDALTVTFGAVGPHAAQQQIGLRLSGAPRSDTASRAVSWLQNAEVGLAAALPGFRAIPKGFSELPIMRTGRVELRPALRPFQLINDFRPPTRTSLPRSRLLSETSTDILMPVQLPGRLDIAAALTGLKAATSIFDVEIAITAMELTVSDQLLLGRAARQRRPYFHDLLYDPAEARRCAADLDLFETWMSCGAGWRVQAYLVLPEPMPDLAAVTAAHIFAAPKRRDTEPEFSGALNLAFAVPSMANIPPVFPDLQVLERLGFAGIRCLSVPARAHGPTMRLGTTTDGASFAVPREDLARHILVLGATGTGKSTALKQMLRQDIADGIASVVVDPHGDLFQDALDALPPDQCQAVCIADASGRHGPFGLDLLKGGGASPEAQANFVANQFLSIFRRVLYQGVPESTGPMFEAYFRNAILLLMLSHPAEAECSALPIESLTTGQPGASVERSRPSLMDFDRIFHDAAFRRKCLETCSDPHVVAFWRGIALKAGGESALSNLSPYIVSKFTQFTGSPLIRPIISGDVSPIDFAAHIDAGDPILFNLAKGTTGEKDAALLGALLTIQLFGTLLARCARPRSERRRVRITMDEYQTFATDALGQMLSEARKTGAEMVLASQDLTSFGGSGYRREVAGAILSNVGNILCFRTGPHDAALLADWFHPHITPAQLMSLPDRVMATRTLCGGTPVVRLVKLDTEETR